MIKISVIIPLFHGESYIISLLDMLEQNLIKLNEAYRHIEVESIFVNDSPEEPIKIKNYTRESSFSVKLITPDQNRGIHGARALGLKYAEGDYILFLDQDDEISDSYLCSQLHEIGKADMVVCNGVIKERKYRYFCYRNKKVQKFTVTGSHLLWIGNPIWSPGQVLIRKSSIPSEWRKINMKVNGADDYFLWFLMFKSACSIKQNIKILYYHNYTGQNLSNNIGQMVQSEYEMLDFLKRAGKISKWEFIIFKRRIGYKNWLYKNGYKRIVFSARYIDIYIATILNKLLLNNL